MQKIKTIKGFFTMLKNLIWKNKKRKRRRI